MDDSETAVITRVIDGDTVKIFDVSVRLLGINAPERKENYYLEAKTYLESLVLNRSVKLEFGKDKYDKYDRLLAYLIFDRKNVNVELVEEGFANYYFPSGKDKYYDEFVEAWEKCLKNNKKLCEKSLDECANCIKLGELNYEEEVVVLKSECGFDCDLDGWMIKDEGRKEFYFENFVLEKGQEVSVIVGEGNDSNEKLFWGGQDYVWTDSGDTLFLRDDRGKLVLWESY